MTKLIYSVISSLDGYFEDAEGRFDWATPDHEVHAFVNELERPIGTYLYGCRMYETMVFWETVSTAGEPAAFRDYAGIWRAAEKIVYSRTLQRPSSARTRIERDFQPDAVRQLKLSSTADISVGGGELAGEAIGAGLVDECHVFLCPIVVGGGKRALPHNVRRATRAARRAPLRERRRASPLPRQGLIMTTAPRGFGCRGASASSRAAAKVAPASSESTLKVAQS